MSEPFTEAEMTVLHQPERCVICDMAIIGSWVYHARLNVYWHADHMPSVVMGENIEGHTVTLGRGYVRRLGGDQ